VVASAPVGSRHRKDLALEQYFAWQPEATSKLLDLVELAVPTADFGQLLASSFLTDC